jgi:hypothetical protein
VVHRQSADDRVEGSVGKRHRSNVPDEERRAGRGCLPAGVRPGAIDHGRIEVEAGDVQPVIAGEADRQLAGPASNVEDASAFGGRSPDVLGDPLVQGAEQEAVAKPVLGAGMSDEDASWHPSPPMSSQVTSDGYRARDRSDGSD